MSANLEVTWQRIGDIWRTDELRTVTLTERLAKRVQRQSYNLRVILAGEIVLTLGMLVASGAVIIWKGEAHAIRVGAMVLLYTAGVWAFTLWNRRGIWTPYGETTADFVALLRVRAQRRMRSAWFSIVVVSLAMVLVSRELEFAWRAGDVTLTDRVWLALGAYSVSVIVWSVWYHGRARREIRELDALAGELETDPSPLRAKT